MAGGAKNYDLQIKLMMIGDQAVGKTALLVRYADDDFNEVLLPTIGIDFKIKTIELGGKRVKLQIWDTAGQERFRTTTQAYYRGAMGILLIYDVTNTKSWSNVRNWVRNIESNAPQTVNRMLIGNKCDMTSSRQVTTAQGETLAREYGMRFLETSSRDNINVGDAFLALATDVVYVALIEPVTCQLHVWRDQGGGATKVVYIAPRTHFRVSGLGFRVSGLGFRNSGFGFRFRVSGLGFRISGFGFSLSYFGFRGSGSETLPARRGGGRTCDGSRARPGRGGS